MSDADCTPGCEPRSVAASHWLKISVHIKVLTTTQPSWPHNLISVLSPRSTYSSPVVTSVRPPAIHRPSTLHSFLVFARSAFALFTDEHSIFVFIVITIKRRYCRHGAGVRESTPLPTINSPVVDEERMRPGHWLGLVLCVFFGSFTQWQQ